MRTQSALSTEYVPVHVRATINGVSNADPTADTAQMAFLPVGTNPGVSDWHAASWTTIPATPETIYIAQCLVGPSGTVTLTAGTYQVWVKITDSPEIPVDTTGLLQIV